MSVQFRHYRGVADYQLIDDFLIRHYQPGNQDGNWIEPAWEYMHGHSWLDKPSLEKIGIWEAGEKIVSVVHYESRLGEVFFQFHPEYRHLRQEMLVYAEQHLYGTAEDGRRFVQAFVNDDDQAFIALVQARGYEKDEANARPVCQFLIADPFPAISLPEGFRVKSLAEDCDWVKIHRVLWRGFDHPGEPPAEDLDARKRMQDVPNFNPDLKIVVQAPNGSFASFCGMWYVPACKYAYVEPVATDPDYRRMGLGKAAVLEGIRRCKALGANVAYVGSDEAFYQAIGFQKVYLSECWVKYLG